jgi:hypothetical protein
MTGNVAPGSELVQAGVGRARRHGRAVRLRWAIAAAVARLLQVLTAGRPTAKAPELKTGHTDVRTWGSEIAASILRPPTR